MHRRHPNTYRPDIDGLRALAVLLVVGFHLGRGQVPGGFIGVDIFFVISGYLITALLLRGSQLNTLSLIDFYAGRCRRIIPALALVLAATWSIGWFAFTPDEYRNLGRHLFAGATFTSNFLLWRESGYFDLDAELKPLMHLWSLGVEEQFYLLWPVLLLALVKRRLPVSQIILSLLIFSFALNILFVRNHAAGVFYLFPTRFWELMAGAALAHSEFIKFSGTSSSSASDFPTPASKSERILRSLGATGGLALIFFAAFGLDSTKAYPGWFAAIPVIATILLIYSGPGAWPNLYVFSKKPVVTLGLISYPLYLWHWSLLSIAHIIDGGALTRAVRISAALISLVLAYLTWRFVEKPVKRMLTKFSTNRHRASIVVAGGISMLLFIGAVGVATDYKEGFTFRMQIQEAELATQLSGEILDIEFRREIQRYPVCFDVLKKGERLNSCYLAKPEPPVVVIIGDSHALVLFLYLAQAFNSRGFGNVMTIMEGGCAPMLGVRSYAKGFPEVCSNSNRRALELILSTPSVRSVILASRGPLYITGKGFGESESRYDWLLESEAARETQPSAKSPFEQGTSNMISALEATGKQVIFVVDVPELGFRSQDCINRPLKNLLSKLREPCAVPYRDVKKRQIEYRGVINELAAHHPKIRVFDATETLCDANLCRGIVNGHILYLDDNHLSRRGSKMVGEALTDFYANPSPGS